MICNVATRSDEPENEDRDDDFAILNEAVSLFYICNKLQQQSSVQGKLEGGKLLVQILSDYHCCCSRIFPTCSLFL